MSEFFWVGVHLGAGVVGFALAVGVMCALLWVAALAVAWVVEKLGKW